MNRDSEPQKIAECPSCRKAIFYGHSNPWCIECGERFSTQFLAENPLVYQHKPYTGPREEGPSERTSSKIVGYFLVVVGVAITLQVAFGTPNYPRQVVALKMAPYILLSLSAGIGFLRFAYSKTHRSRSKA